MNSVPPLSSLRQPSGELVDDDDFAVDYHILSLEVKVSMYFDTAFDVLVEIDKSGQSDLFATWNGSHVLTTFGCQLNLACILLDRKVFFQFEGRRLLCGPLECGNDNFTRFIPERSDNQRRTRFIDQDTIGFIHQAEMHAALYRLLACRRPTLLGATSEEVIDGPTLSSHQQAISKKVETKFFGSPVGYVSTICFSSLVLIVGC